MATAEIDSGKCGYHTRVETWMEDETCRIQITSECSAIQRLAEALTEVSPYGEISFRRKMPVTLEMGAKYCTHTACPVPVGIIKAVEIAAGLALPQDVHIQLKK